MFAERYVQSFTNDKANSVSHALLQCKRLLWLAIWNPFKATRIFKIYPKFLVNLNPSNRKYQIKGTCFTLHTLLLGLLYSYLTYFTHITAWPTLLLLNLLYTHYCLAYFTHITAWPTLLLLNLLYTHYCLAYFTHITAWHTLIVLYTHYCLAYFTHITAWPTLLLL